jgi:aryl-alcohol dehydrogenase-like predicted oxidoreductase
MQKRILGSSGLSVSRMGLGTSTWGTTTDKDDAAQQLAAFAAAGGNLVDTADVYGAGRSEEILGQVLQTVGGRDDIVLATKAGGVAGGRPGDANASSAYLLKALDASLRRLRTDYIDLWQMHVWDPGTPLEETLSAVDIAVSSGRVRYAGICNYAGWQAAKAATWQSVNGTARLVSAQAEYSLLERGIERELVPAAVDQALGVLAWAPLGRGVLTGKYRTGVPADRTSSKFFQWYVGHFLDDHSAKIVEVVASVAGRLGVSPLSVSLAWVCDRPAVSAALVGARTLAQLRESIAAGTEHLELPAQDRKLLDDASAPCIGYPERLVG